MNTAKPLKIGELVSLKNHPFNITSTTIIGATSSLTPPIMVVAEYINSKKYSTESDNKELLPAQYLCYFYSHKNAIFEKFWFKANEITGLDYESQKRNDKSLRTEEQKVESKKPNVIVDIDSLRKEYQYQLVTLLSADMELGKQQIKWSKTKDDHQQKTEAFLDFLPPVLTVIDIIENKNYFTDRIDSKDGEIKKDSSKYYLKCKWFNPVKQTFSEELLPYKILGKISYDEAKLNIIKEGLLSKSIFKLSNTEVFKIEASTKTFSNSIIEIKDIILNNHKIKIVFKDLLTKKTQNEYLEYLNVEDSKKTFENITSNDRFPDFKNLKYNNPLDLVWIKDKFYQIGYTDKKGRFTKRIITNTVVEIFETEDGEKTKFIIANCLLRNGQIRHFNASKISERVLLHDELKALINLTEK